MLSFGSVTLTRISAETYAWLLTDNSASGAGSGPRSSHLFEIGKDRKFVGLLAEDNRADVLLVEEAIDLYNLSVQLHIVDDGEKAISFIEAAENDPEAPCPEFLLLDLNLPKRSGKEVLQRVRQSAKCKNIPVLIITSSDLQNDREELAQLGADRYFRKPSDYDQFLKVGEVLKELLERYEIN